MMHQVIAIPDEPEKPGAQLRAARATGWSILRTSGGKTLPLADWLVDAGFEAWTPKRTFKRYLPGKQRDEFGRRHTVEIDAPILPTFVFARAVHAHDLIALSANDASLHPAFSVLRHGNRIPRVADREVTGLKLEEEREAELLEQLRAAESREERRQLRAAAANTERERIRLLKAERRQFDIGAEVVMPDAPMFAGMSGVVESCDGKTAMVVFNRLLTMKIETWRLVADGVQPARTVDATAK